MKMSVRKIFSIIIAVLALYLFINMFIPYFGSEGLYSSVSYNMWDFSTAFSIMLLLCLVGVIAVYVLSIFNILKEKWVNFVNYAVGFVAIFHIGLLFHVIEYTKVGIWLGAISAVAMLVLSVLWYFMSDKPLGGNKAPVTGYDAKTGKPVYAKQKGFDPRTGKPVYEDD